ncbi:MAG: ATP-binding protein [Acidimicrobiia bacterium]
MSDERGSERPTTPVRASGARGRLRRALAQTFRPGSTPDAAQLRLERQAARVRVGVITAALVATALMPGFDVHQRVLLALVFGAYLLITTLISALVAPRAPMPASGCNIAMGHGLVFAVLIISPDLLTVGMLGFGVTVIAATMIANAPAGLLAAAGSIVLQGIAELHAEPSMRHNAETFVVFAVLQVALVLMINALIVERRRVTTNLARLHAAMRSVSPTPSLPETLDSIVHSVSDAVGAAFSGVLLLEGGSLVLAAPQDVRAAWPTEDFGALASAELGGGLTSPMVRCMRTGETIVIGNVERDERFPEWTRRWSEPLHLLELRSLVIVPLRLSGEPIGVLAVCFHWVGAIDESEVGLLETYADQAALVIVRAQAYERERSAVEKLGQTDRLKSEFLAMVSHELRTPLTAVKGFVDTVLLHWDRLDDGRRQELLRRASGNADQLARLIGQLLDFSRIDADRIDVQPVVCSLGELVDGVLMDVSPILAAHEVRVDVPGETKVSCDPEAFDHILINLLGNAVKFSPTGSEVAIRGREDGDVVTVSVVDHGSGISPEEQDRIFERFYQSPAPAISRRGTGIGLAIVKRFVDLQGGRVWVESELGVGSTFSFTLKNARAATTERAGGQYA